MKVNEIVLTVIYEEDMVILTLKDKIGNTFSTQNEGLWDFILSAEKAQEQFREVTPNLKER